MTPNEAMAIVDSKARGRTRYEDQHDFLDEVLVEEIRSLRKKVDELTEKLAQSSDLDDIDVDSALSIKDIYGYHDEDYDDDYDSIPEYDPRIEE